MKVILYFFSVVWRWHVVVNDGISVEGLGGKFGWSEF